MGRSLVTDHRQDGNDEVYRLVLENIMHFYLNGLCAKGVFRHLLPETLDLSVVLLEGHADLALEAVDHHKVWEER